MLLRRAGSRHDGIPHFSTESKTLVFWRWVQFCLLGRPQLTVKPARSFGLQRVYADLNLVNVTAFGASQRPVIEAVACLGNSMNLCARLTHGTARTTRVPRR